MSLVSLPPFLLLIRVANCSKKLVKFASKICKLRYSIHSKSLPIPKVYFTFHLQKLQQVDEKSEKNNAESLEQKSGKNSNFGSSNHFSKLRNLYGSD